MPKGVRWDISDGKRMCPRCGERKPLEDFSKRGGRPANYCRPCGRAVQRESIERDPERRARQNERAKEWRKNNPRKAKDGVRRCTYGVAHGTYDRMLATQNGGCAICKTKEPGGRGDFHFDHCHKSQKVRGLLCHNCNQILANAKDDVEVLLSAARYLKASVEN